MDGTFRGVSMDSRHLQPGNLFVALAGMRHDGHDFVAAAYAQGAAAALVDHPVPVDLPQLIVPDTSDALGELARAWRERFDLPMIAVAGSNGKTTVKGMVGNILRQASEGRAMVTRGNLNNHIGMPLTLLRLGPSHRFAVIELGADHPGEIAHLTRISQPTLALITNSGLDHLAGFGGREGAARANGELLETMTPDGIAVLNADDPCCPIWEELATRHRVIRFGLHAQADVQGSWRATATGGRLDVTSPWGEMGADLPLLGEHNGANALAATAAALALEVTPTVIAAGLAATRPIKGRLRMCRGVNGARLIDDSYNANPSSLAAALDVIGRLDGDKILILGDMDDLGDQAVDRHINAGEAARGAGIDRLYAIGGLANHMVRAFGSGGQHFPGKRALIDAVQPHLTSKTTVLVKGSRCMSMENVVEALTVSGDEQE